MRACPILIVPIVDFLDILYIRLCVKVNFANQFQSLVVRLAESKTETLIPKVANMGIFCRMPYPSQNYYFFRDFFATKMDIDAYFYRASISFTIVVLFLLCICLGIWYTKNCAKHTEKYTACLCHISKKNFNRLIFLSPF